MVHADCDKLTLLLQEKTLKDVGRNIDLTAKEYFSSQFPGVTKNSPNYEEALKDTHDFVFSDPNSMKLFLDAQYYIDYICHGDSGSVYPLSDFGMEVFKVPEFGAIAGLVSGVSMGSLVLYNQRDKIYNGIKSVVNRLRNLYSKNE